MRTFSGRVTPWKAPMMAVVRVRRSTVAQREARRQRVRIGLVVEQDEHAVGVGEIPLVLLHARAGQRSAEFGGERRRQQLRQVEVRDLGHDRAQLFLMLAVRLAADVEDVQQAAAGVADRRSRSASGCGARCPRR